MGFARKIDLSLDSEILVQEAGVLVIDVRRAELMAEKVLKQHSVRLKVALSEWAVRTAEGLQKGEVRLRDQAQAMLAIKAIGSQLALRLGPRTRPAGAEAGEDQRLLAS